MGTAKKLIFGSGKGKQTFRATKYVQILPRILNKAWLVSHPQLMLKDRIWWRGGAGTALLLCREQSPGAGPASMKGLRHDRAET